MGATFDPELVEEIGAKLLAPEAKLRAASVILAPTCNIQRVRCCQLATNVHLTDHIIRALLEDGCVL